MKPRKQRLYEAFNEIFCNDELTWQKKTDLLFEDKFADLWTDDSFKWTEGMLPDECIDEEEYEHNLIAIKANFDRFMVADNLLNSAFNDEGNL